MTRSHRIIEGLPDSVKSNAQTQSEQSEERPYCACGLREIEEYCKAHDDAVCKTCKARKHVDCITCPLGELTESFIVIKLKHVTKKTDEIQGKLEKMLVEGEEAQRTLWESYRKCENDIYQIAAMIADAQFYGKDRELAVELERIEHEPQRMLADQIEACRISIKKLSNQYKCTQKYKVAEEKDKALDSVLQLSNILKDVKGVIQEMGGNIKKTNLVFKANENLDILERLKNEKWGEIKLETAE